MSDNVADITVAVQAAGAEDAQKEIEGMDEALEDSTDAMSDQADEMQVLNRRMSGLGATLAATMAVTATGILNSIPVVGEAFSGLIAIWDAVMFQLDDLLRAMGAEGIGGMLFDLSSRIFDLEGPLGWFVGILGILTTMLTTAGLAFLAYTAKVGGLVAVKAALIGAGQTLVGILAAVAGAISLPLVAVGILIAALGLLVWHFREEIVEAAHTAIEGVLNFASWVANDLPSLISDGLETVTGWFTDLAQDAGEWGRDLVTGFASSISNFAFRVRNAVGDLSESVSDKLTGLANSATGWGRDLINNLVDAIRSRIHRVSEAASEVAEELRSYLPSSPAETGPLSDLDQTGPGFVETVASGIESNVSRAGEAASSAASAMSGGGGFSADRGSGETTLKMDGRKLVQNDGRYRRDGTARRGRQG